MENLSIGVSRSKRDLPPAHFSLKIQSYSLLAKSKVEKYDSGVFETGGHKWRLSLYPNEGKVGFGYISLFLEIAEADTYPEGWEVHVNFKLFVLDHLRNKYLTIQDADGAMTRLHEFKTECGFEKLLALEVFKNSSNGYLVDDCCCEFGAEVFVYKKNNRKWETLAMVKQPSDCIFTYKLQKLSTLNKLSYASKVFTVAEINWMLRVYPRESSVSPKGKSLSVALELVNWKSLPTKRAIYAELKLRVLDQVSGEHKEVKGTEWFSSSRYTWCTWWGDFPSFMMPLQNLNDVSKGSIKNDALIVEAEFLVVSVIKVYS